MTPEQYASAEVCEEACIESTVPRWRANVLWKTPIEAKP